MQLVFELQEPLGLFFFQPGQRRAGHLADDLGDDFLIDHAIDLARPGTPIPLDLFLVATQRLGFVAQLGGLLVVCGLDRLIFFDAQPFDLLFDVREVGGLAHGLEPNPRARLIDHID